MLGHREFFPLLEVNKSSLEFFRNTQYAAKTSTMATQISSSKDFQLRTCGMGNVMMTGQSV